jgi:uncharacterized glyoxalase superfamily protein PhnB
MAIIPYPYYEDVGEALKFLSKAFGLRNYGRPMLRPDGKVNHAAMKLGNDGVMMGCPPGSTYKNPKRLGQSTQSLYINIDNVDKHCERARKAGAKIIEEPAVTSYGQLRYGAEDPEGHQWYFAQDIKKQTIKKRGARRPKKS